MAKQKKSSVWKNYFSMLFHSRLPWLLMLGCFLISLGRAQLALVLADKIGTTIVEYENIRDAVIPLLVLFLLGIGIVVCKVVGAHLEAILTAQAERNIQKYAVEKVFYLKITDIEQSDPRELVTRLTEDTAKSAKFLIDLAVNEIPRLYFIVGALISVIQMNFPLLTITLVAVIPVIFLGALIAGKITFKNRNEIQLKIAMLTAKLAEKIDNIEIIKSYNSAEAETMAGDAVIDELDKVKRKGAVVDQINAFIQNMLWFLPLLLIIIPPATLMFNGEIDQGTFYAYILLATTFRTYTSEHLQLWIYLKDAQGATLRLSTVLSLDNERTAASAITPGVGDIEFKNVSFAYGEQTVLDNVSFTIKQGKKTALVGFSGSGKSTILNLIEKFYSPTAGSILLNGVDIGTLDFANYRSLFSYLPQNAPCFSGTIREILNYASPVPHNDDELTSALNRVGLLEDIAAFGGLDYQVGYAAGKLSGGQRQKLGIARLLLSDTEFVMTDEATSALDTDATRTAQQCIDQCCAGRTQIAVAHDLSTVVDADKILVFSNGKLVGEGSHTQLLKSCDCYQQLLKGVKYA